MPNTTLDKAIAAVPKFGDRISLFTKKLRLAQYADGSIYDYRLKIAQAVLFFNKLPEEFTQTDIDYYLSTLLTKNRCSLSFFKHTVFGLKAYYNVMGYKEPKGLVLPKSTLFCSAHTSYLIGLKLRWSCPNSLHVVVSTYPAVKTASIRLPCLFMLSAFFITTTKSFSIHLQSRLGMPNMLFVAPVWAKHASTISLELPCSGFQYFSTKAVAKSSCIQVYRRTKSFSSLIDIFACTFSILLYSELEVITIFKRIY